MRFFDLNDNPKRIRYLWQRIGDTQSLSRDGAIFTQGLLTQATDSIIILATFELISLPKNIGVQWFYY